jgi:hypothetical protein
MKVDTFRHAYEHFSASVSVRTHLKLPTVVDFEGGGGNAATW